MTSITLDKTWSAITAVVDTNIYTTASDQSKRGMYLLKEAFKTAGWTVTQSCDSVSVSASDILTDYTKFVWAVSGSVHSWFVVKNTNLGTNFSVCCDCNFAATQTWNITVVSSMAGYQTGTTTNRPVVNVGGVEHNFGTITHTYAATLANRKGWAILYSSDGCCFRAFAGYGTGKNASASASGCVLMFEKLKNPVSWFTNNVVSIASPGIGSSAIGFRYSSFFTTSCTYAKVEINSISVNVGIGTIGVGDSLGNTSAGSGPDYNGNFILTPCHAISLNTSYPGILGSFYDMYGAPSNIPEGIYFKTSNSNSGLVKFGVGAFGCSGNKVSIP